MRSLRRFFLWGFLLVAAYFGYIAVSLALMPSVSILKDPRVSMVITVKDWNGDEHPFVVGPKNRNWTPARAIPAAMKRAVVASEDGNFYKHEGVDFDAMKKAIQDDIKKGKFARGGSTITQQVAKNLFLSREKTITRKLKELYLARRLDSELSKGRVLELYLNVVELGPMVYGIGHGARYYFGKPASALTVRECAFFAAMLPGPKALNPYKKMDKVMARSTRIVRRMYAARMISGGQYAAAMAERPNLSGLARKVEQTLAAPPPVEPLPPGLSADNAIVAPSGPAPPEEAPAVAPDGAVPAAADNEVI
ncbi:MAG TPA: monofunctional biosynthetic peptidoglycan transglycosylase [Candidatus Deferrimicrobiaceae bacterium]|jgi:monofunctional biosynthetic peptidoglycan transglycosylase